ncbi:hypothetical protein N7488_001685 [Penicillium malachiteum]|nr:hypothetical protein N7488_001685 [Penicillium malachiteum]
MVDTHLPLLPEIEFKAYCEDENFQAQGKSEPQTVIYRVHDNKLHIKITLHGAIPRPSQDVRSGKFRSKRERRSELKDFVTMIDLQPLVLLDDTVPEVVLNEEGTIGTASLCLKSGATNELSPIENIQYRICEDPLRVKYLSPAHFPSFRAVEVSELIQEIEISDGVFRVFHTGYKLSYVLKIIHRPLYHPRDTDVIKPCQKDNQPPGMVINGILLEFHSGGSLKYVLKEQCLNSVSWEDWAIQIGNALDTTHQAEKAHMDLKPLNIGLDKDGNVILVDISGIGGITHGWQAPIRDKI